jgi:bacteriorhodopsin
MKDMVLRLMAAGIENPNLPCADGSCSDANLVGSILGWAYFGIGVVGVIIIIYSGVQYMMSEGEPEKTKRAQMAITYTVIGLIVATLAWAIISFVTGAFSE